MAYVNANEQVGETDDLQFEIINTIDRRFASFVMMALQIIL